MHNLMAVRNIRAGDGCMVGDNACMARACDASCRGWRDQDNL